eukprot:scaffold2083_cov169-Pinguiococcus_pyrenoidosus.AAC.1
MRCQMHDTLGLTQALLQLGHGHLLAYQDVLISSAQQDSDGSRLGRRVLQLWQLLPWRQKPSCRDLPAANKAARTNSLACTRLLHLDLVAAILVQVASDHAALIRGRLLRIRKRLHISCKDSGGLSNGEMRTPFVTPDVSRLGQLLDVQSHAAFAHLTRLRRVGGKPTPPPLS